MNALRRIVLTLYGIGLFIFIVWYLCGCAAHKKSLTRDQIEMQKQYYEAKP